MNSLVSKMETHKLESLTVTSPFSKLTMSQKLLNNYRNPVFNQPYVPASDNFDV